MTVKNSKIPERGLSLVLFFSENIMPFNIYLLITTIVFILVRLLDAFTTAYGLQNVELAYEINSLISTGSPLEVLLSPFHFILSMAGIFSICLVFVVMRYVSDFTGPKNHYKYRLISALLEVPNVIIMVSLVAVINNLVIIFSGGWHNIIGFSLLFSWHELIPLVTLFLTLMLFYELLVKKKLRKVLIHRRN